MIKAKDVMSANVVTASPNMTLKELSTLLVNHQITGAPVVNTAGFLVGVISETDIARHESQTRIADQMPWFYVHPESAEHTLKLEAPEMVRVKDYMTPIVISASRQDDIVEIAKTMLDKKIHRIIIAEEEKLYGIVTATDVMRALVRELEGRRLSAQPSRGDKRSRVVPVRSKRTVPAR